MAPPSSARTPRPPTALLLACALLLGPLSACAQVGDDSVVAAREALRKNDRSGLVSLRDTLVRADHPLAMWADYWELSSRLPTAQQPELNAFYARWSGSYVEDRLRNDWLLELGKRRDWPNFERDHAAYRMQDDRDVACYALLTRHLAGQDVKAAAVQQWHAQRDLDDACHLLATTLAEARQLPVGEVWQEMRLSVESNRPRAVRAAAALVGPATAKAIGEVLDQPARYLQRRPAEPSGQHKELALLALMRLAASDIDATLAELQGHWARRLDDEQAALAWAMLGRQAAIRLQDRAHEFYEQAWRLQRSAGGTPRWSDDTLAWATRAALRSARLDRERWGLLLQAVESMSAGERNNPAWRYWKARALDARARSGSGGDEDRAQAQALFEGLATETLGFYPQLALQRLGRPLQLPPAADLSDAEQEQARSTPGLRRGLQMAQLGLRDEGRREWNFTLRGMQDTELLAAAQLACQAADWQLCINTSERSRERVDVQQRYPLPFAGEITRHARAQGLDPALVFGLIRQETRFMSQLRSSVGASGLMQLMPATARWTARKAGIDFQPAQVWDIETNLQLGTLYLKLVLDDLGGSQAMATAAYNAGPGRPRRWREGPVLEAAAWAENIPFSETRDYVQKVLSNASVYTLRLGGNSVPLPQRLGSTIGPREASAPATDSSLP